MQRFPALFLLATLTLAGVSALTEPLRRPGTRDGRQGERSASSGFAGSMSLESSAADTVLDTPAPDGATESPNERPPRSLRLASSHTVTGLPAWPGESGEIAPPPESVRLEPAIVRTTSADPAGQDRSVAAAESGLTGSVSLAPAVSQVPVSQVPVYTVAEVRAAAHAFSPEGNLLESEARTAACNIDPSDEEARCSAILMRSVLMEVSAGRRADDAALAAKTYHKLVAAEAGWLVAQEALKLQDDLIELAEEAERLELPDGDVRQLRQQRLELQDAATQQLFARRKLRQELARLTGWPEAEVAVAVPTDPLPEDAPPIDAAAAVDTALAQRHDLQAVANLCAGMNRCSLPAARQLLGALTPGVGLSLATVAKGGLLACLHDDRSDDDLAARRRQCRQLYTALRGTVRNETLQAVLDVRLAQARLELVTQRIELARQRLEETEAQIELDQAEPGSDLLLDLQLKSLRGTRLERQLDLAVALDEFDRVRSMPLETASP